MSKTNKIKLADNVQFNIHGIKLTRKQYDDITENIKQKNNEWMFSTGWDTSKLSKIQEEGIFDHSVNSLQEMYPEFNLTIDQAKDMIDYMWADILPD